MNVKTKGKTNSKENIIEKIEKNKKRREKLLTAAISVLFVITAITVTTLIINAKNNNGHYDDLNGEYDTSLAIIIDSDIENPNMYGKYKSQNDSLEYDGENRTGSDIQYDFDFFDLSSSRFSGLRIMQKTLINSHESWLFTVFFKVNHGNARLYLLSPDYEIMHEFKIDEDDQFVLKPNISGEYTIILAGENAAFELSAGRKLY